MKLMQGDCLERMKELPDNSVDSIVTDPPYELGFMGKKWDSTGIANNIEVWKEALRVLKPGGHLLSFSGSRTYHRMTCAIEDAGFDIRDQIMWVYGSGFPKSHDVSKAIDKTSGTIREVTQEGHTKAAEYSGKFDQASSASRERRDNPATDEAKQYEGWGTALKPAHEPICVARKPLIGTVAKNVLGFGTGAINIDGCRVATDETLSIGSGSLGYHGADGSNPGTQHSQGRWPANLIHDGSDEVLAAFPDAKGQQGKITGNEPSSKTKDVFGEYEGRNTSEPRNDAGSAARFFYCAKSSKKDRGEGNTHPTVKPQSLM